MAPVCVGSLFLGMAVLCVCLLGCCLPKNAPGELSILEVFPLQTEREGCDTVCFPLWAEALLFRAQEGTSWLSGLFAHFCDYLLVC